MSARNLTMRRAAVSPAEAIYILGCLGEDEYSIPGRMHQGIVDTLMAVDAVNAISQSQNVFKIQVGDRATFEQVMKQIAENSKTLLPLIFIDGHGDEGRGLRLPNEEYIDWSGLISLFGQVTMASRGELTVVASFCHSMELIRHLDPSAKLPFSMFYGYESTITVGVIELETKEFYKSVIQDGGQKFLELDSIGELKNGMEIRVYSEYDHIGFMLAVTILMRTDPKSLGSDQTLVSVRTLKKMIDTTSGHLNQSPKGARNLLKKIMKNNLLSELMIKSMMHDTKRREYLLEDVRNHFALFDDAAGQVAQSTKYSSTKTD